MSFGSYSTTPASNISINGISIAENCPAANLNNALRQLAADGKELYDTVAAINVSNYVPKSGAELTGGLSLQGAGSYRYNANASHITGATYFLPTGSTRPSNVEGVLVFYY